MTRRLPVLSDNNFLLWTRAWVRGARGYALCLFCLFLFYADGRAELPERACQALLAYHAYQASSAGPSAAAAAWRTVSSDGFTLWRAASNKQALPVPHCLWRRHSTSVAALATAENFYIATTLDHQLEHQPLEDSALERRPHRRSLRAVRLAVLTASATHFAHADVHGRVVIYRLGSAQPAYILTGLPSEVTALHFFPDGERLFIGDKAGEVRAWHFSQNQLASVLQAHEAPVLFLNHLDAYPQSRSGRVVLHPGPLLVTASVQGSMKVWHDGVLLGSLIDKQETQSPLQAIAMSPQRDHVLFYTEDGTLVGWSVPTQFSGTLETAQPRAEKIFEEPLPVAGPSRILYTRAPYEILLSDQHGDIWWLDLLSGRVLNNFKGHRGPVTGLGLVQHGRGRAPVVISSGGDGEIRLWSLASPPRLGLSFLTNPSREEQELGRRLVDYLALSRRRYLASPFVETPLLSFPVRPEGMSPKAYFSLLVHQARDRRGVAAELEKQFRIDVEQRNQKLARRLAGLDAQVRAWSGDFFLNYYGPPRVQVRLDASGEPLYDAETGRLDLEIWYPERGVAYQAVVLVPEGNDAAISRLARGQVDYGVVYRWAPSGTVALWGLRLRGPGPIWQLVSLRRDDADFLTPPGVYDVDLPPPAPYTSPQTDGYQSPNLKEFLYEEAVRRLVPSLPDTLLEPIEAKPLERAPEIGKFLMVIAAETYPHMADVPFAERSARNYFELMIKTQGIPLANSFLLLGDQAGASGIERGLRALFQKIEQTQEDHPRVSILLNFYFAGHIVPVPADGFERYLGAYDTIPDYLHVFPFLSLSNLAKRINAHAAIQEAFLVLEGGLSGMSDGRFVLRGVPNHLRALVASTVDERLLRAYRGSPIAYGKVSVLSSASSYEARHGFSSNLDVESGNRMFTAALLADLLENPRDLPADLPVFFESARQLVQARNVRRSYLAARNQVPQLYLPPREGFP